MENRNGQKKCQRDFKWFMKTHEGEANVSFEIRIGKIWKSGVLSYSARSHRGRAAPDCSNYLAFDANLTPVKTEHAHKHISWLGVKGQIKHSAALWRSFRGKSLCLTLEHIYFPFSSHTQCTHPLIWPLATGAPVPQPIDSLALNLNLGATETTIKEALSLSKTDCRPNNTCSLSLISPFIEWTTYPQLS